MDDKQFDSYIRDHLHEELPIPDSLNWENMDIQIPTKKRRRFFFLPLVVLGAILSTFLVVLFSPQISTQVYSNQLPAIKIQPSGNQATVQQPTATTQANENTTDHQVSDGIPSAVNTLPASTYSPSITSNYYQQSNTNQLNNINNIETLGTLHPSATSNLTTVPESTASFNLPSSQTILEADLGEFSQESTVIGLERMHISQIEGTGIISPTEKSKELSNHSLDSIKQSLSSKWFRKHTLQLTYGLTWNQTHFSSSSPEYLETLSNTTKGSFDKALSIVWDRKLSGPISYQVGASWLRLHQVFSYEKDLGFKDDYSTLTRTFLKRIVHHNNIISLVEFNLGLAYNYPVTMNSSVRFYGHINPGMEFRNSGKTLNYDLEIVEYALEKRRNLVFNGSFGADYVLQLKNCNLVAGVSVRKWLQNLQVVDADQITNKPVAGMIRVGFSKSF